MTAQANSRDPVISRGVGVMLGENAGADNRAADQLRRQRRRDTLSVLFSGLIRKASPALSIAFSYSHSPEA